jgi:hypothetical protein
MAEEVVVTKTVEVTETKKIVEAHDQLMTNHYTIHFPPHPARTDDPHYKDFNAIHRAWKKDPEKWQCFVGKMRGDYSECDYTKPLELHHAHIEFSMQNGVEFAWLEKAYPGIADPTTVGAWVETAENLMVLCVRHHRGSGGIHHASASDYEAAKFIRNLIA